MLTHVLCIRRLAKILVGATLLAAAAAPAATAHTELPSPVLDAFHPLGAPVTQPWLAPGQALETASADAAFSKAKAGAIVIAGHETKVECIGDGTGGKRVQIMYVRDIDTPDNYAAQKAAIGAAALGADRIYRESAAKTQGPHRIRFVHDSGCTLSILNVVVDDPADLAGANPLGTLTTLVQAQGFTDPNRKYVMLVDTAANVCGIANRKNDDSAAQTNASNGGSAEYARIDFTMPGCRTSDRVIAHELGHNLGAVQTSAPNSNGTGHCTDE